ncbi:hypothetical protein D187_003249 [Cystobacter fuscus DSM 2262]|uniref:Uncharacterized protein n=1 Tax=Cystobacter fuscus (strain ATCC 25194 / DSM 2262 / NBRC 100088 / M29) TaxID=1242864 RepID=S9R691_CYSF2|nr:hypothetical protein D187_003249 [Cystobacter fuscus DSM 2262]
MLLYMDFTFLAVKSGTPGLGEALASKAITHAQTVRWAVLGGRVRRGSPGHD